MHKKENPHIRIAVDAKKQIAYPPGQAVSKTWWYVPSSSLQRERSVASRKQVAMRFLLGWYWKTILNDTDGEYRLREGDSIIMPARRSYGVDRNR